MDSQAKVPHGTAAWFDMVGAVMCEAAAMARLGPDFNVSLAERYTDGAALPGGLVQGLRFAIAGGKPSFRSGVEQDAERADITVEVTTAASRELNTLPGADPAFHAAYARLLASGELRVTGDFAQLGSWYGAVHDRIVAHTL